MLANLCLSIYMYEMYIIHSLRFKSNFLGIINS